jgi:hypothetical protein
MNILQDFDEKLGGEDIFKPAVGNESLHQESNANIVRKVNFATSQNLVKHSCPTLKHL